MPRTPSLKTTATTCFKAQRAVGNASVRRMCGRFSLDERAGLTARATDRFGRGAEIAPNRRTTGATAARNLEGARVIEQVKSKGANRAEYENPVHCSWLTNNYGSFWELDRMLRCGKVGAAF